MTQNASEPLIQLNKVSKRFKSHKQSSRSFQELFVNLFQGPNASIAKHPESSEEHLDAASNSFFWSLHNVSFDVYAGDSIGLIGPNGSGKSTLLKLISGIIEPTEGEIAVNGRIASLLELGAGFHPDLTGRENIYLNGSIYGLTRQQINRRMKRIIRFSELEDFIDVPVKHYSSGMYVRLGFSVAIQTSPDILLVDEVLAVGDATFQHKCMSAIQAFRANGGTLLLVSHDLGAIQSLCNQALWFDHGEVQEMGHPTDVVMSYMNRVAEEEEAARRAEREALAEEGEDDEDMAVEDKGGLEADDDGVTEEEEDQPKQWGTGEVRITDVLLYNEAQEERTIFQTGTSMEIRLYYDAPQRVEEPIFGLAIYRQDNTHICGPNTKFGQLHIESVQGEGYVSYHIEELALLEGAYLITTAIIDQGDTLMYDYQDRAYEFSVFPGASQERYGIISLQGAWSLTETEPVDSEPVDSEPVDSEPVDSEPVDSEPVDSEPVDSQPVDSEEEIE
ncbi:MAG: Wzt carbohydrate-binding domain-containing protein [Chloroflexota bacterium]